ncbi:MAG: sensor histidine kinase, partial [Gammaproteobacteria bacterium]
PMKRSILSIGLAVAALALLGALVLQSRPVPVDVHIAHHAAVADLERTGDDFSALVTSIDTAWINVQTPGAGSRTLAARVTESPARLSSQLLSVEGGASQEARVQNRLEGYSTMVSQTDELLNALFEEQSVYVQSVDFIRESGPEIVQQMRDIRLDRAATDTFQLMFGTLDFASSASASNDAELRRLLVSLGRDQRIDANMPGQARQLLESVETVLNNKQILQSRIDQIAETPLPANAESLSLAAVDLYRATLISVDQGRSLLAIYAVLLLAAAGVIAFRLNQSYRYLNQANFSLENVNSSLEQRVSDRTDELAGTLENLKESQVQLVQAEKMSSLGQLVAGISHEINTPLLYLANNAVLIQERLDATENFVERCKTTFTLKPEDFESKKEFQKKFLLELKKLKTILRTEEIDAGIEEAKDLTLDSIEGLNDLTEMAQSLKDFSRLDRSPVGSFDVNAGLEKSLTIARNALKHKANVRKFFGELPEIECSPSQINQIFLNIITNAAQAVDENGEIIITTKLKDENHVSITIADNGCGISEENLGKIRDPFFTTKEVGTGTGLGLSIVDEIMRAHGGELAVASEVGKGSTFTITLPIAHSETPSRDDGDADAPDVDAPPSEEMAEAS